jgi:hypothetical protein
MDAKESNQEQWSEEKRKIRRRQFLMAGGAAVAGSGLTAFSAQEKPNETDKALLEQLASFDTEERANLAKVLREFNGLEIFFNDWPTRFFLNAVKNMRLGLEWSARKQKEKQEYLRQRDSLPHDKCVRFVLGKVEKTLSCYACRVHESTLLVMRNETPIPNVPWAETVAYAAKRINEHFEGCSKSFRSEVIDLYLQEVLPGKKEDEQAEETHQEAVEGLLDAVEDMTPIQIDLLTKITAAA